VRQDPSYGLRDTDCEMMAWVIAEDGSRVGGAQAFALIASVLLDKQWPVTGGRLPVLKQALDFGYRLIAKNRYRFPGDTRPIEGGSCRVGGGPRTSCPSQKL
jgi:predicted DCC family thiol-disulfide oxidoreductase YuxK